MTVLPLHDLALLWDRAVPGPTQGGTPKELPSHSPDFKNKILVLKELNYCYYGVDGINVTIEILEFNPNIFCANGLAI